MRSTRKPVSNTASSSILRGQRPGLGAAFTREIEGSLRMILEAPDRCRFIEQDVRRCLAHIFPYGVLYTVESDFILSLRLRTAAESQVTGANDYHAIDQAPNTARVIDPPRPARYNLGMNAVEFTTES